jgi:hypothetical protein
MTSLYREWESAAGRVPEPAAGAPAGAAGTAD